ncbi:MAG TPA: hypothetical protein VLX91_03350 [Candidatus Acidoferrales bacterium]|nr:hypothetical protein [Candidatus Acidoferrales bacterium]
MKKVVGELTVKGSAGKASIEYRGASLVSSPFRKERQKQMMGPMVKLFVIKSRVMHL